MGAHLKSSSGVVRKATALCLTKVIDLLADRFVAILNDFIPFLSEMLDDEEPEISSLAKGMVKQIGQFSSENVYALIKASH
jgi:hypothetical protein